jgi:hypothetical protein
MNRQCVFTVSGTICDKQFRLTKFGKEYCQITIALDDGYESLYVHDPYLIERLRDYETGQNIRASGQITPRSGREREPVFLNPQEFCLVSSADLLTQ